MATSSIKTQCFSCKKEIRTFICEGCSMNFCLNCLNKHIQELNQEFDQIENDHDQFRQKLNDQRNNTTKQLLIKQIDQWENDSINKIKQKAEKCREKLINYSNKSIIDIEHKLNDIANRIKQIRQENNFNEIDLNEFKQKLNKLKQELDKPSNISIEQQSTSFVNNISIVRPLDRETTWKRFGITIAGGNDKGEKLNQLSFPYGIIVDDDNQTIYIVDTGNHRIVEWKSNATNGQIVAGGNGIGNQMDQLNFPTDIVIDRETNSLIISDRGNRRVMRWSRQDKTNGEVIISDIDCWGLTMDKYGSLYVSDYKNNEVKRWKREEKNGILVAGGHEKGDKLDQFNSPTYIFIDEDDSLYVSDCLNHRVIKWLKDAKEGIVVAGGNGRGNSLTQLSSPEGLIVDQLGQIYVADYDNHRVMRWYSGAKEGMIVVGGNAEGQKSNQFNGPFSLSFDREGNLYVADCRNHRIQELEIE